MPNGSELYNLGGGKIAPVLQQGAALPLQGMQGMEQGGFNVLDFMKGLFGEMFGGSEGRFGLRRGQMSPEERLAARNRPPGKEAMGYYDRYQLALPQYQTQGQGFYTDPKDGGLRGPREFSGKRRPTAAYSSGSSAARGSARGGPATTGGGSGMPTWSGS